MATAHIEYSGNLRCQAVHLASGSMIQTDAPVDNHGKGEAFSPTDLAATSLGNCMLTVMGIKAQQHNWDITGATVEITKHMANDPRRISGIDALITFPARDYDDKTKQILEHTARTCPVSLSLHPDISQNMTFNWL
jgi:putative redox protein